MNLILFTSAEAAAPLLRTDLRAVHLLDVLRRKIGDTFDTGLVNGPRGKGTITGIDAATLTLAFNWGSPPPPPDPITLIVGLPRPQTARDILRETTALGLAALHFVTSKKGESSYAQSTLWTSGEWHRHLVNGAQQAFVTQLPHVTHGRSLAAVLAELASDSTRLALDNYESPAPLSHAAAPRGKPVVLALGSERGWSAAERTQLREAKFQLVHLGPNVLRTETACIAALTLIKAQLGSL